MDTMEIDRKFSEILDHIAERQIPRARTVYEKTINRAVNDKLEQVIDILQRRHVFTPILEIYKLQQNETTHKT